MPLQLEALSQLIEPPNGQPTPEDASRGWEQYRTLSLKLSRLATRLEELTAPPAVPNVPVKAGGGGGGGRRREVRKMVS